MSQSIFKNWFILKLNDKQIDKSYEDFRMKKVYLFNKFLLISLLVQSLFACIFAMTNLKMYALYKPVKFATITSYLITFIFIIFLILDRKRNAPRYFVLMQNFTCILVAIVNFNTRCVFVKYLNISSTYDFYIYILEILFRFICMLVISPNSAQCVVLNLITIIISWIGLLLINPAFLSLVITNTTAYTVGLIFVQFFQYFFERKNKEAFYYNALSKKNSDWLTGVFNNINTGFISIKSGKISFIISYLKSFLPKVVQRKL